MTYRFRKASKADRAWIMERTVSYIHRYYPQIMTENFEAYQEYEAFVNERWDGYRWVRVGGLLVRFSQNQVAEIHAVAAPSTFRDQEAQRVFLEFLEYQTSLRNILTWETTVRADNHDVVDALEACGFKQYERTGRTLFLGYWR